jgi:hypothetical protein
MPFSAAVYDQPRQISHPKTGGKAKRLQKNIRCYIISLKLGDSMNEQERREWETAKKKYTVGVLWIEAG